MHRDSATAHATHDELLIARLYGDDVDEQERAGALARMAACEVCADLFADFGAIARATVAMRTPPRPRDFTLSPADAARLGRPRRSWATIMGWGRARALGGSLAALGFAGMALMGAITTFAPGANSTPVAYTAQSELGNRAPDTSAEAAYGPGSAKSVASQAVGVSPFYGGGSVISASGSPELTPVSPAVAPSSSSETADLAVGSPGPEGSSGTGGTKAGGNDGSNVPSSAASSAGAAASASPSSGSAAESTSSGGTASGGGIDLRLAGLAGFAALAALGLALLLAAPRLNSRRIDR